MGPKKTILRLFFIAVGSGIQETGSGINIQDPQRNTVYGIYQICFSLPEVKKEEPMEPTEAESSNVGK
jgi:hypothetical protein